VHVLNTRSFKNQVRSGKRVVQKVMVVRVHVLNTRSFKNQVRSGKRVVQKVMVVRLPGKKRRLVLRFPGKLRARLVAAR